jgi:CheY-like chemotaxis protein
VWDSIPESPEMAKDCAGWSATYPGHEGADAATRRDAEHYLEDESRNAGHGNLASSHVQASNSPEIAVDPAPDPFRGAAAAGQQQGVSRKRILIADDHEMLRRGVRTMLQNGGDWEICGEAINGQDAVDKVTALHPDLVILDINMPVLNGLAAVRQILRNSPEIKILVFTVHESDQAVKEIRAAGAHCYSSKAKGGEDLLRVVKNLLQGKSLCAAASN